MRRVIRDDRQRVRRRISNVPHSKDGVSFVFSRELLSTLAREYWENRPLLIERPFLRPLIQSDELFGALVAASERFRSGDESAQLRFYVEQAQQIADVGKFLPRRSDGSTKGYSARIKRMLRGRTHALYAEDIQVDAPEIWLRFREFLGGLGSKIDLTQTEIKATAFVGDYRFTPPGLHRGQSGNFKFVVEGTKRMLLWPDKFFRNRKNINHTAAYKRYRKAATLLDGKPGDVIYWPSDQWHIGECVGGPSASVSLALFGHCTSLSWHDLWNHVSSYAQDQQDPLPDALKHGHWSAIDRCARKTFHAAIAAKNIEEALSAATLNRLTGAGFSKVPFAQARRSFAKDAIVQGDPDFPILWKRCGRDDLVCSANGHAFAMPASERLVKLLRRLNRGRPCQLSDLIKECGQVSNVRALLEKLLSLRAVFDMGINSKGSRTVQEFVSIMV